MMFVSDLIAWILVHVGVLYLVTESAIASPVRRLLTRGLSPTGLTVALLYCPGCVGFWLGIIEGLLGLTIFGAPSQYETLYPWIIAHVEARVIFTGFAGMGLGAAWGSTRPGISVMFRLEQLAALEQASYDHPEPSREVEDPEAGVGGDSGDEAGPGVARPPAEDDRPDRDEG